MIPVSVDVTRWENPQDLDLIVRRSCEKMSILLFIRQSGRKKIKSQGLISSLLNEGQWSRINVPLPLRALPYCGFKYVNRGNRGDRSRKCATSHHCTRREPFVNDQCSVSDYDSWWASPEAGLLEACKYLSSYKKIWTARFHPERSLWICVSNGEGENQ